MSRITENDILDFSTIIDNFPNKDNMKEAIAYNKEMMARKNPHLHSSLPPAKISYSAKINKWDNLEEENTGFVFLQLPVGYGGRTIPVAIGTQDYMAETKGLKSVINLDAADISICARYQWRVLDDELMGIFAKRDADIYAEVLEFKNYGL